MKSSVNPELIDEDNPEWTEIMFSQAKNAKELFPHLIKSTKKTENNFVFKRFYFKSIGYVCLNFISPLHYR